MTYYPYYSPYSQYSPYSPYGTPLPVYPSLPPVYTPISPVPYVPLPPYEATVNVPALPVPYPVPVPVPVPVPTPTSPYAMMSPFPYNPYEFYDPNRPCIEPIPESDSDDEEELAIIPTTPIAPPENPQWSTSITLTKKKSWHRKFPTMSRKDFSFKKRRLSLGTYGPDRLRFDALNPAPRPSDWRPDYVPPHSSKSHRFSLRAKSGQNPGIAGKITYKLHPFLQYISSTRTPLAYDIRQNPNYSNMQYLTVPRPGNQIDWCQVATTPAVHELHLYHRRLPWIITIRATQTNGITLGDVFDQIHQSLSVRVTQQEVYNSSLNASDREEIATACYYRNGSMGTVGGPMLRVDFLGFEVVLLGLVKGKHGLWEMMTQSALQN